MPSECECKNDIGNGNSDEGLICSGREGMKVTGLSNLSKFECGHGSPQETSKGPCCPSSCQEDQGHNDSLLGSDACDAVIEVDEEGKEQEAKDACNHQGSGDVEPCGIKDRLR